MHRTRPLTPDLTCPRRPRGGLVSSVNGTFAAPPYAPTPANAPLTEIRDNLIARIAEARREGWLGEVEGLQVSLAGAEDKLALIDQRATVDLGLPAFAQITGRAGTATPQSLTDPAAQHPAMPDEPGICPSPTRKKQHPNDHTDKSTSTYSVTTAAADRIGASLR